MGRPKGAKNKPKVLLSDEDKTALEQGSITSGELAQKYNADEAQIYRIKNKSQLKTSFHLAEHDPAIPIDPNNKDLSQGGIQNGSQSLQGDTVQVVNYDVLVSAFWGGIDSVSSLLAFVSRGQIEYKPLTKDEIDRLTQSSKGNSIIQKLSSVDQMSNLILLGTIAVIFKDRFKLKKKHNEKDPKCKCDQCKKVKDNITQEKNEKTEEIKKDPVQEDLNNTIPSLSTVKDMIIEPKDENNNNGEIIQEQNDFTEIMQTSEDKF